MIRRFTIVVMIALALAAPSLAGCRKMCERCGHVVMTTVLEGINFEFNKATIKPEGKAILDKNVAVLSDDKTLDVSIEGHCDIIGSDEYNQKLSEARARSVYDYFLSKGIDASRMRTVGYGRSRPIVPNDSEANRAKNRRVEINIIKARP